MQLGRIRGKMVGDKALGRKGSGWRRRRRERPARRGVKTGPVAIVFLRMVVSYLHGRRSLLKKLYSGSLENCRLAPLRNSACIPAVRPFYGRKGRIKCSLILFVSLRQTFFTTVEFVITLTVIAIAAAAATADHKINFHLFITTFVRHGFWR